MFKFIILSAFIVIYLEGCSSLRYTEQLLVLKRLSDSQRNINNYLGEQEKFFEKLLADIKKEKIELGTSKDDFLTNYGKPVLIRKDFKKSMGEVFLYRYPTKYFNSDKVYVYFDRFGKLVNLEHYPYQ